MRSTPYTTLAGGCDILKLRRRGRLMGGDEHSAFWTKREEAHSVERWPANDIVARLDQVKFHIHVSSNSWLGGTVGKFCFCRIGL